MSAISNYVAMARLVMQSSDILSNPSTNPDQQRRLNDFYRQLSQLRQFLSCVVCCRLLTDPFAPKNGRCQHNVCRLCVRGRKVLRPLCTNCSNCADFKTYEENRQMHCLLLCYKSLCEHLMSSTKLFTHLSKQKQRQACMNGNPVIPLPTMSAQDCVLEGANYEDILSSFTVDLPRTPKFQVPPMSAIPILGTLTPITLTNQTKLPSPVINNNINSNSNNNNNNMNNNMKPQTNQLQTQTIQTALSQAISPNTSTKSITPPFPTPPPPLHTPDRNKSPAQAHPQIQSQHLLQTPIQLHHPQLLQFRPNLTKFNANSQQIPTSVATITYVGPNMPGVVVPMVSGSLTAPLTIASAKLQSLKKHLFQTNNNNITASLSSTTSSSSTLSLASSSTTLNTNIITQTNPTIISTAITNTNTPALSHPLKVSISPLTPTTTSTITTPIATVTTQKIQTLPPPIKTVSNGSAMYSVMYTGIGNKITIKRKTESETNNTDEVTLKKNVATSTASPLVFRQMPIKFSSKRRGCRCGNATPTPGKLTCCGQRCPCYVDSRSCVGCKCRGCRNPHRPDGGKVRPIIPQLACYEIQMAEEVTSSSSSNSIVAAATTTNTIPEGTKVVLATTKIKEEPTSTTRLLTPTSSNATTTTTQFDIKPIATPTPTPPPPQPPTAILTQTQTLTQAQTMTSNSNCITPTLVPFRSVQTIDNNQQQHHHNHNHQHQQHHVQTQNSLMNSTMKAMTTGSGNLLQLENLHPESVLIQNADGKYQVINLFTRGPNNQIPGLQQIHTLTQLTTSPVGNVSHSGNTNSLSTGNTTTFILPANTNNSSSGNTTTVPNSTGIPTILLPTHHLPTRPSSTAQTTHQQQHQHQTPTIHTLPFQIQQQLKQNNIITVHPITTSSPSSTNAGTATLLTSSATPATITLSPIIVTSAANGRSKLSPLSSFTESSRESEEYVKTVNPNNGLVSVTASGGGGSGLTTTTAQNFIGRTVSHRINHHHTGVHSSGHSGGGSSAGSTGGGGGIVSSSSSAVLLPAMLEVIETTTQERKNF